MELDEHEQGEAVRTWLRQNGSSLITGITLGLALVFGWQWWQGRGARHHEEAAVQYVSFTDAVQSKDLARVKTFSTLLADKYADTPYSSLAALRHAAFLHETGKSDEAVKLLRASRPKAAQPDFSELFSLRLARLLLLSGQPDQAAKELEGITKPRFAATVEELRGDIASARGNVEQARKSYQAALTTLDEAAPTRRLVELKLIDAGGQPPAKPEI